MPRFLGFTWFSFGVLHKCRLVAPMSPQGIEAYTEELLLILKYFLLNLLYLNLISLVFLSFFK
jgi:hypothetical protein